MMKYVLFAVGLLLIFVGSYSVYSGSAIIEVERGWSSVIAGTTATVGGVLIVGLAWLIRSIEQLRAQLNAAAVAPGAAIGLEPAGEKAPVRTLFGQRAKAPAKPELPAAPVAWPPNTTPASAASSYESQIEEKRLAPTAREMAYEPRGAQGNAMAEAQSESDFAAEAQQILETPFNEPAPAPARAASSVRDLWRRVAKEVEKKPAVASQPAQKPAKAAEPAFPSDPAMSEPAPGGPVEEAAETTAAKDDWLDQAFAEFDAAIAQTPYAHLPQDPHPTRDAAHLTRPQSEAFEAYGEPYREEPKQEPYRDEPHKEEFYQEELYTEKFYKEAHEEQAPPMAAEPPETEFPAATEPAVIGRYEAEGTSYIMFADGSIEAQSERGVARFKSMADLKAYFETQETPQ